MIKAGLTSLSCAAKNGHLSTVEYLVAQGADLCVEDEVQDMYLLFPSCHCF